jgi:hypothetical protein
MTIGKQLEAHIDVHLGTTPTSVVAEDSLGIHVATFNNVPTRGIITSVTVGLSAHLFEQEDAPPIRQELLMSIHENYRQLPWEEVLLSAGKVLMDRHRAFEMGEVLGPAGPLFPEAPWCHATALLCSLPVFFDAEFPELEFDDATQMVFVELIPITTAEARWIREHSWEEFFERINANDVDIVDLGRS